MGRQVDVPGGVYGDLHQVLDEASQLLDRLVAYGEAKQEALLARDAAQVEREVAKEEEALAQLIAVEERRAFFIEEWASRADTQTERVPTLDAMVAAAPEPLRRTLSERVQAVAERVEALREVNALNGQLVRQALAHTNMLVGALTGEQPVSRTYGRGKGDDAKAGRSNGSNGMVDRRI